MIMNQHIWQNTLLAIFYVQITVSKSIGNETGMAIVEVGLMSGFVPSQDSLNRLARNHAVDGQSQ